MVPLTWFEMPGVYCVNCLQGQDLATGNLTAPAIFALQSTSGEDLREMIDDEFSEDGALDRAISIVNESGGIAAARKLAGQEAEMVCPSLPFSTQVQVARQYDLLDLCLA